MANASFLFPNPYQLFPFDFLAAFWLSNFLDFFCKIFTRNLFFILFEVKMKMRSKIFAFKKDMPIFVVQWKKLQNTADDLLLAIKWCQTFLLIMTLLWYWVHCVHCVLYSLRSTCLACSVYQLLSSSLRSYLSKSIK